MRESRTKPITRIVARSAIAVALWAISNLSNPLHAASYTFTTFAGPNGGPGAVDGAGAAARFNLPFNVAVDSSGNVYVAEQINNTIRKITPGGVVTTLAGTADTFGSADGVGAAARFYGPHGVAVDSSGNVYVADTNNHTIRKITAGGVVTTFAGISTSSGSADGTGAAARFHSPQGVAVDSSGNVYVADSGNLIVRKITSGGVVTTLAGTANVSGSADGTGPAAQFSSLQSVAVDGGGNVYVADFNNNTIRKITSAGVVTTFAGTAGTTGSTDATGAAARFNQPVGIAVGSGGNVYVADSLNYTVRKITPGGAVTTLAGTTGTVGSADGTGTAAQFNELFGVAADSNGNVYVADTYNNTIRKITSGGVVTTLAGQSGGSGKTDATGSAARFFYPEGAAVDSSGNVFIVDSGNETIRKITPGGVVTTFAGSTAGFQGSADGAGTVARFSSPIGAASDGNGNIYVADYGNCTIRKITSGAVVTTLAGSAGIPGSADGTGAAGRFRYPFAVAADSSGNVYVADSGNHTIRKITSGGVVITLAGLAGTSGSADGTGSAARFFSPEGVAVDSGGNVYVADTVNSTIRKITAGGVVTTFAGKAGIPGSVDGAGTAAQFSNPNSMAIDSSGNLFVLDNETVRKITSAGVVTTLGGLQTITGSANGTGSVARFNNPQGIAVDSSGNVYVADTTNHLIRIGSPATLADVATIDAAIGNLGVARQLNTAPQTATSWSWSIVRQPPGSTAMLSSTSIRNPTFTPDVADLFIFQLTATGPGGTSITQVSLTGTQGPVFTSVASIVLTVGTSGVLTVSSTGNPTPSITRGGAVLPSGVTFVDNGNGTGTLSGTPAAGTGGVYALTFTAANGIGANAVQNFTLTVNQALQITSGNQTTFTYGTFGTLTVTTTGFPIPSIVVFSGSLPSGVVLTDNGNGTATLSGTSTTSGTYNSTFRASNGVGTDAAQNFTLTVDKATATVALSNLVYTYDGNLHAATATTNPPGLSVTVTYNGNSIPPSAVGTYTVVATIQDPNYIGMTSAQLVINAPGPIPTTTSAVTPPAQTVSSVSHAVSLSAMVSPQGGTQAVNQGTVKFQLKDSNNTNIGTSVASGIVSAGNASVSYTIPANTPAGIYTIIATYTDGVNNFAASSDSTHTLTINAPILSTVIQAMSAAVNFSVTDQTVNLTATVTSTFGVVNDGFVSIQILNGSTLVGNAVTSTTVTAGAASVVYVLPGFTVPGNYSIQATYSKSKTFADSSDTTGPKLVVLTTGTVGNPPVITTIAIERNPVRINVPIHFTATALPTSNLPIQSYEWRFFDSTNAQIGATFTGNPIQNSFGSEGKYTVTVVASDGVAKSAAFSYFTVTLAPNIGASARNVFNDGVTLPTVTNPTNGLGIMVESSVGGAVHFDSVPGVTTAARDAEAYTFLLKNRVEDAGIVTDPNAVKAAKSAGKFQQVGISIVELNGTVGPKVRKVRVMIPVGQQEVDPTASLTDTRGQMGVMSYSVDAKLALNKISTVRLSQTIEVSSGLTLDQMTNLEFGLSNLHTKIIVSTKGKVTSGPDDRRFAKVSVKMPKVDHSGKTPQGATMTLLYSLTATGQQLMDGGLDTDGLAPSKSMMMLKLQFGAIIAGMTYRASLPVLFTPHGDFGNITARGGLTK